MFSTVQVDSLTSLESTSSDTQNGGVSEQLGAFQGNGVPQIEIIVYDPEKFGDGMNAYIVYKIKTTVSTHTSSFIPLIFRIDLASRVSQAGVLSYSQVQRFCLVS